MRWLHQELGRPMPTMIDHMSQGRALATAPLAIFPVALIFMVVRSLVVGDLHELFVAPISAGMITIVGYPFAVAAGWLLWRTLTKFGHAKRVSILAASMLTAEAAFWLVISPLWQREFSAAFCVALVGACGLACGGTFLWLVRRQARRQARHLR